MGPHNFLVLLTGAMDSVFVLETQLRNLATEFDVSRDSQVEKFNALTKNWNDFFEVLVREILKN
jgi:hypothetical protein